MVKIEIFKLFGSILVDSSKAEESISKTEQKAESFGTKLGNGIKTAGKWAVGVGAAAGAVGTAMFGVATKTADAAGEIADMAARTGETAEEFQKYAYAAKLSGMEAETLEKAMIKQQKAFSDAKDGSASMSEAYQRLGIDIDNIGSSSEAFDQVISKLANMTDETERNALANDIFGKSYAELTPLLNEGADGIAKLKQEAVDMGAVMSNESVAAGEKFGDTLDSLKMAFGGIGNSIGSEMIPLMQSAVDWIIEHMPEIKETIGTVVDGIKEFLAGLRAFWDEYGDEITVAIGAVWDAIKLIVQTAMDIIKGIIDVVSGLISGDWDRVWKGLKTILEAAFELINAALQAALDGLVSLVKGIGKVLWEAGKEIFQKLWDGMKEKWDSIKSWFGSVASKIKDTLFFWQKSKDKVKEESSSSDSAANGSHAGGLAYVPYDGYVAELHRGERVLTAQDNSTLAAQIVNALSTVLNTQQVSSAPINIKLQIGDKEIAQATYDALVAEGKRRGVAWGV